MSLNNLQLIDAVGTETKSGETVLSLIDEWDWQDEPKHLLALQQKLNAYFKFVESRQIFESYPSALNSMVRIDIISKFPLPQNAFVFLRKASNVAAQLNLEIRVATKAVSAPLH